MDTAVSSLVEAVARPATAAGGAIKKVRPASAADEGLLVDLGLSTGPFTADEAEALLRAPLRELFADLPRAGQESDSEPAGERRVSRAARVLDGEDGLPVGWTYLSVDPSGPPHVWELFWIGVKPAAVGRGAAATLLAEAELTAKANGAGMLLISTSSTDATARARAFYSKHGYAQVGRIPHYYGPGDDKMLFHKMLE